MKTLPLKKRFNGFNYAQVLCGQRSCIYRQEVDPNTYNYEVFKIKVRRERILKIKGIKKSIEAHETWPNDEAFGYWAWSCRTIEKAELRFIGMELGNELYEYLISYENKVS